MILHNGAPTAPCRGQLPLISLLQSARTRRGSWQTGFLLSRWDVLLKAELPNLLSRWKATRRLQKPWPNIWPAGINGTTSPSWRRRWRPPLRRCCFAGLESPKRQDLAHLDHVEVAFRALEHSINLIAGDRRPRSDDLYEIAYAATQVHVEHRSKRTGSEEGIEQHIIRVVQEKNTLTDLTTEEARIIAGPIIDAMQEFSELKCAHCSLDCFSHPQVGAAQLFFSSQHPFQPKASGSEMESSRGFSAYRAILSTTMEENDDADEIVSCLRGFWRFLGREFGFKNADACLHLLGDRAADKLQQELADSTNFSTAKSFMMEGEKRGFDLSDEAGPESPRPSDTGHRPIRRRRVYRLLTLPGFPPDNKNVSAESALLPEDLQERLP